MRWSTRQLLLIDEKMPMHFLLLSVITAVIHCVYFSRILDHVALAWIRFNV